MPSIDFGLLKDLVVKPGESADLARRETDWTFAEELKGFKKSEVRARSEELLEETRKELAESQDVFYASKKAAAVLILQAMDAGGKDGTIKHVMSGVNPQGCVVSSFKVPSAEERAHDFLWRYHKAIPERGMIGIFNRSYYEDVLVVRVHPELLPDGPPPKDGKKFWKERYESINDFEKHLKRNGVHVLKCFLHISKDEQKKRLLKRLTDPSRHWKFSASDLPERGHWDEYQEAFEAALTATSTEAAPWWVIPADQKWVARTVVAALLERGLRALDPHYPEVTKEQMAALEAAKAKLESE